MQKASSINGQPFWRGSYREKYADIKVYKLKTLKKEVYYRTTTEKVTNFSSTMSEVLL